MVRWLLVSALLAGCNSILGIHDLGGPNVDAPGADAPHTGPDAPPPDLTVYAHADHVLYKIALATKTLTTVGLFQAPMVNNSEDVITDLAVAPGGTIYAISQTALYTVSPADGHVSPLGSIATCGMRNVALTATPDNKLYAGDGAGAICEIDVSTVPPTVKAPVPMQGGLALSGDLVAVSDGTVFGSAVRVTDGVNMGTQLSNLLVTVDVKTGAVVQIGTGTNFPKLFGMAYANGQLFGFTHDGSGRVVTIDPGTGVGTLYGTFVDPSTTLGISFAGAGVNALVPP